MNVTLSRRGVGISSCSQTSRPLGEKCILLAWGQRRCALLRDDPRVKTAYGETQSRGKTYGVGVSGGVERLAFRARIHHEAGI